MLRWLRQYLAVSRNALAVSLSDPVYLILLVTVLMLMAFFGALPTFNFGQELRLIRDQSLALLFIGGCVVAALVLVTVVVRDLHQGTVAVLLSRPVSSLSLLAGRLTGLAVALALYHLPASLACLWVTRIVSAGEEGTELDQRGLIIYFASILVALGLTALRHYFFGGWYVWQASLALVVCFFGGFVIAGFFHAPGAAAGWAAGVDWRTAYGCVLVYLAEVVFAAALLPFAVSLEAAPMLGIAAAIFLLGTISNYLVNQLLEPGAVYYAVKGLVPNWQGFWISDVLANRRALDHGAVARYVASCLVHTLAFAAAALTLGTWVFDRREVFGDDAC